MTASPVADSRALAMKSRTTGRATSASSKARRTSRRASSRLSRRARHGPVSRSNTPVSRSPRASNIDPSTVWASAKRNSPPWTITSTGGLAALVRPEIGAGSWRWRARLEMRRRERLLRGVDLRVNLSVLPPMTETSQTGRRVHARRDRTRLPRMVYGAMQLPGPHVWGPPKDEAAALPCCARRSRSASTTSTRPTSTAPHVSNRLIKEALSPYPDDLIL